MTLSTESALRKDKRTAHEGTHHGNPVSFQHRHLALLAHIVSEIDAGQTYDKDGLARLLANHLKRTNSSFDRARWFAACGVKE